MHFLKPEIEMFINRNSDDDDEREEGKRKEDFYLNWRLFYVLKLQFFSLIVAPRLVALFLRGWEANSHKKIKKI